MNLIIKKCRTFSLLALLLLFSGCEKFLDEKPDKKLVIPSSVKDLQAMFDYNGLMNGNSRADGEASSDNYYLTYADWASLTSEGQKNTYIWESEIYFDAFPSTWSDVYLPPYYANVALEYLQKFPVTEQNKYDWNNVKGSALFYRAKSFHLLALLFAKAYDSITARQDLGIPLRLASDFNSLSVRSNNYETYGRIISDLSDAIPLLPLTPVHVLRPSKPAAYALLSRVYLSMRDYFKAGLYADSCLQLFSSLLDFNTLNASANFPVSQFNNEVVFHNNITSPAILNNSRAKIDSMLYASYAQNDLRKAVYFKNNGNGTYGFKGSYNGSSALFDGIAADEMYLVKAECLARAGKSTEAMAVLNTLLSKRYKAGTFSPLTAADAANALSIILTERRKELLMRDLRWMDLKRLNKESAYATTIVKILNGQVYQLPPNDNRYALPVPRNVIDMTGMPQNPR